MLHILAPRLIISELSRTKTWFASFGHRCSHMECHVGDPTPHSLEPLPLPGTKLSGVQRPQNPAVTRNLPRR